METGIVYELCAKRTELIQDTDCPRKEMRGLLPYLLIYGLIFCGTVVYRIRDFADRKRVYCVLIFSAMILLLGLRHPSMGSDLGYYREYGYLHSYDQLSAYSWKTVFSLNEFLNYEWGYVILNKLIGSLTGGSRQMLLLVCAGLSLIPVGAIVYRSSEQPLLSAVIYMGISPFLLLFSGLRQGIAVGICAYSLRYIFDRKPWHFLAAMLLAVLFHDSAVVFLAAYPVYYLKLNGSLRWCTVPVIGAVYLLRRPLFRIVGSLFSSYSASSAGGFALFLIFCAMYLFCCVFMDHSDERVNGLANLFFCACICQTFGTISSLAIRVGYYYIMSLILLLPGVLKQMKKPGERRILEGIILLCFIYQGLNMLRSTGWAMAYPYCPFWATP